MADPLFRSWLVLNSEAAMICRLCSGSGKNNNFIRGCRDMQKSALLRHLNPRYCVDHQQAVREEEQRKAMVAAAQEAMTIQEGAVDKLLRAVYWWLAKEEVATAKFRSLLHFLQFLGVDDLRHLFVEDPTRAGVHLSYTSYHAV